MKWNVKKKKKKKKKKIKWMRNSWNNLHIQKMNNIASCDIKVIDNTFEIKTIGVWL